MSANDHARSPLVTQEVAQEESVCLAVSEAVSDASGVPETELPPLGYALDADALSALFDVRDPNGSLHFDYAGYRVVLHADRRVEVYEAD